MTKFKLLFRDVFQWWYSMFKSIQLRMKYDKEYLHQIKVNRLAICTKCDWFKPRTRQCGFCYCFVDIKAGLPAFDCDLGYWEKENV